METSKNQNDLYDDSPDKQRPLQESQENTPDDDDNWDTEDDPNDDDYVRSTEDDDDDDELIPIEGDDDSDRDLNPDTTDDDDELDPLADRPTTFSTDADFTSHASHGRTSGAMIDHEPGLPGPVGGRQ